MGRAGEFRAVLNPVQEIEPRALVTFREKNEAGIDPHEVLPVKIAVVVALRRISPPEPNRKMIIVKEVQLEVDMVVSAIGQKPVTELMKNVAGVQLRENGTIQVNDHHQTGNAKYFAGGDCVNGGKEVVDAVAEGMAAARGIDAWCDSRVTDSMR